MTDRRVKARSAKQEKEWRERRGADGAGPARAESKRARMACAPFSFRDETAAGRPGRKSRRDAWTLPVYAPMAPTRLARRDTFREAARR